MTVSSVPVTFPYWWASAVALLGRLATWVAGHRRQAVELPSAFDQPRDCVLVLDASPSMLATDWPPSRLRAAQEAAETYCRRLAHDEPEARIALVAYGGHATVLCPLTPVARLEELLAHIGQIRVVDSTNITDGAQKAANTLARARGIGQVVLLTDGHHNKGPRPQRIASTLKQHAVIECVGIGGRPRDVQEALLRDIASAYPDGRKRYRWIGDKERLVKHFHKLAGGITRE